MTLIGIRECEAETGYAHGTLKQYRGRGEFIEPAKRVGNVCLYDLAAVRKWKRDHIKRRDARGLKTPA